MGGHTFTCSVPHCINNTKSCNVRLYTFPKDAELFKTWIKLINRPDILLSHPSLRICGLHFNEEEKHTLQCKLFNQDKDGTCKCQVTKGCIPSKKLPDKSMVKIKRLERQKRRSNRKIVQELLKTPSSLEPEIISFQPARDETVESENMLVCEVSSCCYEDDEEMQIFSDSESESFAKIEEIRDPEVCYLEDLCRMCAQPSVHLVPVFGEEGNKQNLQNKINTSLPISICENDGLPQSVCEHCISRLESSLELATSCQEAEGLLRRLLEQQEFFQKMCHSNGVEDRVLSSCRNEESTSCFAYNQQIQPEVTYIKKENNDCSTPEIDANHTPSMQKTQSQILLENKTHDTPSMQELGLQIHIPIENKTHNTPGMQKAQLLIPIENKTLKTPKKNSPKKVCKKTDHKLTSEILKAKKSMIFSNNPFFLNETKMNDAGLFVCKLCLLDFDTIEEKKAHLAKGHTFSCLFCDFSVKALNKSALDEHYKTIHFEIDAETTPTIDNFSDVIKEYKEKLDDLTCSNIRTENGMKHLHFLQYLKTITSVYCNVCLKKFPSEEKLKGHDCISIPTENPVLNCPVCNFELHSNKEKLKMHIQNKHKLFPCKSRKGCIEYFNTLQEANAHYLKVHRYSSGMCELCGKTFKRTSRLNQHVYYVHGNPENQHKCHLCPKTYRYKQKLNAHLLLHSDKILLRPCPHCDKKYPKPQQLNQHILIHHKDKLLQCECGKKFATKHNLYLHFKNMHLYTFKYHCSICNVPFKNMTEVRNHHRTHSKDVKLGNNSVQYYKTSDFQCTICLKYFKTQYLLNLHVKVIHAISKSEYVSLDNEEISRLRRILSKTSSRKSVEFISIKCPLCPRVCLNKTGYKNHIATHSTDKKFACQLCDKAFPTLTQVKAHERLHNSLTQCFSCCECEAVFGNKIKLENHIRRLHYTRK